MRGAKLAEVAVRNRFQADDQLSLMGPAMKNADFLASDLQQLDQQGAATPVEIVHPNMRILMPVPAGTAPDDLIRLPAPMQEFDS
jgi:U32 family peptidase